VRSIQACEASLALYPDGLDAVYWQGLAQLELGHYESALKAFDRYLNRGGTPFADVLRGRALANLKLGRYLLAVDDYTEVLKRKPDSTTYSLRGWAYFFADAWQPALRDFETASRLYKTNPEATIGRGLARVMLGDYRAAAADADEALRLQPATPEMMHNVACVFAQAVGRVEALPAGSDHEALCATYRRQALEAIRQALKKLPAPDRRRFWREKVLPDAALAPIRSHPEFLQIEADLSR
jgi:tetratricopeptide (TPR) repeat protein